MMFNIGQKIVCVDASPSEVEGKSELTRGAIYTIRGFDSEDLDRSGLGLYLDEVPDDPVRKGWKTPDGWRASRFRPVLNKKTDISIFTEMLNTQPAELLTTDQRIT